MSFGVADSRLSIKQIDRPTIIGILRPKITPFTLPAKLPRSFCMGVLRPSIAVNFREKKRCGHGFGGGAIPAFPIIICSTWYGSTTLNGNVTSIVRVGIHPGHVRFLPRVTGVLGAWKDFGSRDTASLSPGVAGVRRSGALSRVETPASRWFCEPKLNQQSARGVEISTPCGTVLTRDMSIFVPGLFELDMYGIINDAGMRREWLPGYCWHCNTATTVVNAQHASAMAGMTVRRRVPLIVYRTPSSSAARRDVNALDRKARETIRTVLSQCAVMY